MRIHQLAGAGIVVGVVLHLAWTASAATQSAPQSRQEATPQADQAVSKEILVSLSAVDAKLVQDEKDLISASARVAGSCQAYSDFQDLLSQVREADDEIQSVEGLLTMYSYMHSSSDREAGRGYLLFIVHGSQSLLESDVKAIGIDVSSSTIPAGAAAIGVRDRDEIRKTIAVLANLSVK